MLRTIGNILILLGLVILICFYGPITKERMDYQFNIWRGVRFSLDALPEFPESGLRPIEPVDKAFGLVIPKININAEVFPDVDSQNPDYYLPILKKGVAHVKGSQFPDREGNVFLFAHSTDAFYNVGHYNAIFFLIGKLEKGDEVDLFYKGERYKYEVIDKKVVKPEGIKPYLESFNEEKILTLQTCYPPGTTLKRLLVISKQI